MAVVSHTAYHKVLERLPEIVASRPSESARLDFFWETEIARLKSAAFAHSLNRRFGEPQFWRGYHLVLATLRLRVAELLPTVNAGAISSSFAPPATSREENFVAFGGKLRGKPDLAHADEIVDFKTGSIFESDDLETTPELKGAYVRQLRIYAYLLHSASGRWARRGLLYPIAGPPVAVDLEPAVCTQEAESAVALLDSYNDAVAVTSDPVALASPAPSNCKWCPFKSLCPAFWAAADEQWTGQTGGDAVAGRLANAPQLLYGGSAFAISLSAQSGTVPRNDMTLTPFPIAVHTSINGLAAGDRVRIVGLGRRQNGTLFPTLQTVVFSETTVSDLVS